MKGFNMLKMLLLVIAIVTCQSAFSQKKNAQTGEITSLEWNILEMLSVTYAVGRSGQTIRVDCTAFNDKNKPIGGGFSFTAGGVATISIEVPTSFRNSNKVTVSCRP